MNGTLLIALGVIWTEVRLSAPAETTAFCASGGFGSPLGAAVWQEYRESECQQREDSDECGH